MNAEIRIGLVTVSDRASRGDYVDLGGPAMLEHLQQRIAPPWSPIVRVIPDERSLIESTLIDLCDAGGCCLIVTTGGTGPSFRDVTPEATEAVVDKLLPGFGELMRQVSLRSVPTTILSRQTAGIRASSLIVNLPGRPTAIAECLDAVLPAIPYCIDLIDGPQIELLGDIIAFRPANTSAIVSEQASSGHDPSP